MGFTREVYEKVGDFRDVFGEDIDLSLRIRKAGFTTVLLHVTASTVQERLLAYTLTPSATTSPTVTSSSSATTISGLTLIWKTTISTQLLR